MAKQVPARQLAERIEMLPRDTQVHGKITGGAILCHIDLSAAIVARAECTGKNVKTIVTRALDKVEFKEPVCAHDVVTCWGRVVKRGTTSVTVHVEVEADRAGRIIPVTEATAVFVALDDKGKPTPVSGDKVTKARCPKKTALAPSATKLSADTRLIGLRKMMMPNETNGMGNIFGGLLLTYMDMAGAYVARRACGHQVISRLATRFMDKVEFKQPVHVNDLITCYGTVTKVGTTSIHVHVEVEAKRQDKIVPVTEADLVFVAVNAQGRPVAVGSKCSSSSPARRGGSQRLPGKTQRGCQGQKQAK